LNCHEIDGNAEAIHNLLQQFLKLFRIEIVTSTKQPQLSTSSQVFYSPHLVLSKNVPWVWLWLGSRVWSLSTWL